MKIFWLLISPCSFDLTPLKDVQAAFALDNGKSLKDMKPAERDRTLVEVVKKIRLHIENKKDRTGWSILE